MKNLTIFPNGEAWSHDWYEERIMAFAAPIKIRKPGEPLDRWCNLMGYEDTKWDRANGPSIVATEGFEAYRSSEYWIKIHPDGIVEMTPMAAYRGSLNNAHSLSIIFGD